jgi:hypothetical protein
MAAGVKPRSREAVRHLPQGFTRGDSPGEDEGGEILIWLVRYRKRPGAMGAPGEEDRL